MLDWLYIGLGTVLSWFESWCGSYALALLFYALIFKILFLPFAIKQQKNQIKMAKLAPKIAIIKAKYKGRNDQVTLRKQQEEIMALQQKEGYSPLSGCLPLLIQMPIIIFLYNVIRNPLSYIARLSQTQIHACNQALNPDLYSDPAKLPAINQIQLAAQIFGDKATAFTGANSILGDGEKIAEALMDKIPNFNINIFGLGTVNLAENPSLHGLTLASLVFLIPFLAAAIQWFTVWVTRKLGGNASELNMGDSNTQSKLTMRIMDLSMPAMTLFFAFNMSSLMGIYWIYQSVFTILQSLIISKIMPIPKYTEEDLQAMRKAQKEAEKAQKEIIKTQPKYKSLHYIDDDDYEDLKELEGKAKSDSAKGKMSDKPEIKD